MQVGLLQQLSDVALQRNERQAAALQQLLESEELLEAGVEVSALGCLQTEQCLQTCS